MKGSAYLSVLLATLCASPCGGFTVAPSSRKAQALRGSPLRTRLPRAVRSRGAPLMAVEGLWQAYTDALATQPLITKSITASVIIGAGDAAAQFIESAQKAEATAADGQNGSEEAQGVDALRVARWAFFGLVLQAPWNHFFYVYLDQALPPTAEPFTTTNLLKVGLDQGVQSPIFTMLCFVFLGFLEGKSSQLIKEKLDEEYASTMVTSWKVWIPAAIVNIGFVPPALRVLFVNVVFFVWTIYLSLVVNKATAKELEAAQSS